ncbi:MAG TPA: hypothetical protein EYN91_06355 [Candidatus Melainabacteria bacterium]|nr:hypothetical protein [Candidatus Melainabacteria bacterium]
MSSGQDKPYIEFGKSGGSTGQPFGPRRGLGKEQNDPLVLWWVRRLKAEYSAEGTIQTSYRRSRWAHAAEKRVSPIQPFFALHREGRLLSKLIVLAAGLIASLNMVAQAENIPGDYLAGERQATEIPSAQRFSMIKDFVGQHNQYLDLSKLNEFKWTDEIKVATRQTSRKQGMMNVFTSETDNDQALPPAVPDKKNADSGGGIYDAKLKDGGSPGAEKTESLSNKGIESSQTEQAGGQRVSR